MIDLIIPTYNSEDTIERALGSVAAQTRGRKILVTIVDDCSTDNTIKIAEKFKSIIPLNILPCPRHYGKPGLVRQYGVDCTHCPYIMFLDADDALDAMAAEVASRTVLQNSPEVVFSAFYQDNRTDNYRIIHPNSLTWLHGNIYSRKFLTEKNIKFDDCFNEDGSFNLKCFHLADKVMMLDKPMYYWMDNKNSITRSNNNFMLSITYDYIKTYSDAIRHILEHKPSVIEKPNFKADCAAKLSEFFQFMDANSYYLGSVGDDIVEVTQQYIDLLNKYNMIDKTFLTTANYKFNSFNIFTTIIRQYLFYDYLDYFKVDYKSIMGTPKLS